MTEYWFFSRKNICSVNLFTMSSLPGIFKYSKFGWFICPDGIVPYSRFTGLKNTLYIYIYIYISRFCIGCLFIIQKWRWTNVQCNLCFEVDLVYIYIYIYLLNILSGSKSCLVTLGVAVPPWATETVLSPYLAADEGRVSHVLSHVVWGKIYIYIYIEIIGPLGDLFLSLIFFNTVFRMFVSTSAPVSKYEYILTDFFIIRLPPVYIYIYIYRSAYHILVTLQHNYMK